MGPECLNAALASAERLAAASQPPEEPMHVI